MSDITIMRDIVHWDISMSDIIIMRGIIKELSLESSLSSVLIKPFCFSQNERLFFLFVFLFDFLTGNTIAGLTKFFGVIGKSGSLFPIGQL